MALKSACWPAPHGKAGSRKRAATLSGGLGDLATQGFNPGWPCSTQTTKPLNASQRKFITALDIPGRLPDLLSSASFPGNVLLARSQFNILEAEGFKANGKDVISTRRINPSAGSGCNPPASLYLPDGIGGEEGCTFDYMRDIELYPKSRKSSFFGRASWRWAGIISCSWSCPAPAPARCIRARQTGWTPTST